MSIVTILFFLSQTPVSAAGSFIGTINSLAMDIIQDLKINCLKKLILYITKNYSMIDKIYHWIN
jgi:hypothetical protein